MTRAGTVLAVLAFAGCSAVQSVLPRDPPMGTDINTATTAELLELPGVDEAAADRIVHNRPYDTRRALVHQGVLARSEFERIVGRIYVGLPGTPAAVDEDR